ncbi:MAG TPA: response regulator [Stellaceae bacterium]|jgi:DNA-binding NtrC family response regulator|nr:response regulator [Stellaceae bacterium]
MAEILIIDDDAQMRRLLIRILKSAGHGVREASNGATGLKCFHEERPTLVITDIFMPEKEGIETIRLLRQQAPDLPILAISGSGLKDYLNFAIQLGATAALPKPFSAERLLATVAQLVEGSPLPTR